MRLLKAGVLAAVVVALVMEVRQQVRNDEWQQIRVRPVYLALSGLAMAGAYGCLLTSQRLILRSFTGRTIPWRMMVPLAWVPLAGKYIPGKVAAVGTAVVLMRRIGIPATTGLSSFLLLDALPVLSGTMIGSFILWDPAVRDRLPWAPLASVVVLVGGLVCLHPAVFGRLINLGLRLIRRAPLDHVPGLREYLAPSLVFCLQWVFHALSVWFICVTVLPPGVGPGIEDFGRILAITSMALVLSYFAAVLSPAGLGVREGVFVVLLQTLIPDAAAVAAAVGLRVVSVVLEGVLFAIGLLAMRALATEPAASRVQTVAPER